jgi:excinuclease ABC subunit B
MSDLRKGLFDVLVGVNLLREGLDLPEVSLVAILDADKEGFLRSNRTLTQTIGRAARNIDGKAILYADKITNSMQKTIEETEYRRNKQMDYNKANNITPTALNKSISSSAFNKKPEPYKIDITPNLAAAEEAAEDYNKQDFDSQIRKIRKAMEKAAKELDFMEAAKYRDQLKMLENKKKDLE